MENWIKTSKKEFVMVTTKHFSHSSFDEDYQTQKIFPTQRPTPEKLSTHNTVIKLCFGGESFSCKEEKISLTEYYGYRV